MRRAANEDKPGDSDAPIGQQLASSGGSGLSDHGDIIPGQDLPMRRLSFLAPLRRSPSSMPRKMRSAMLAGLALIALPAGGALAEPADMVLFNGKVLTVDKGFSTASAVAVKDGRIVAVGGPDVATRYTGGQRIDLGGRTLMPGFIDTHLHLYGLPHRAIEPDKAKSIVEIQSMIAAKAKALGPGEWVTGSAWDEALLAEKRVPTRADLDAVSPDNPVVLIRAGAHSAVANSIALKLAKIDRNTPDPDGGLIERDAAGEPNGIVRERTDLILSLVPADTPEQMRPSYIASLKRLLSLGITSFMEAYGSIDDEPVGKGGLPAGQRTKTIVPSSHTYKQFRSIYEEIGADLPRATLYIGYPGAERLKAFPYRTGHGDDRLKLGPIGETPFDGGFTGPTALTKADYKGQPGFRGTAFMTADAARDMVATSAALGWQLGIHAIGDAAIETVAQIYHDELAKQARPDHRWFLSHFTMLPSDATMDMMAKDQVWAAAQPNFLYNLAGRYRQTLEGDALTHINPVASPLKHHIHVVLGSDNLPIGPMVGLYAATTRKDPQGQVIGIEEAISRQQAITLYTREAAWLTRDEAKKGSIEPGKFADMIVLDRDPLTVPDEELLATQVDLTIVGGKAVYTRAK